MLLLMAKKDNLTKQIQSSSTTHSKEEVPNNESQKIKTIHTNQITQALNQQGQQEKLSTVS